jgi:hypothetical protein
MLSFYQNNKYFLLPEMSYYLHHFIIQFDFSLMLRKKVMKEKNGFWIFLFGIQHRFWFLFKLNNNWS